MSGLRTGLREVADKAEPATGKRPQNTRATGSKWFVCPRLPCNLRDESPPAFMAGNYVMTYWLTGPGHRDDRLLHRVRGICIPEPGLQAADRSGTTGAQFKQKARVPTPRHHPCHRSRRAAAWRRRARLWREVLPMNRAICLPGCDAGIHRTGYVIGLCGCLNNRIALDSCNV